MIQDLISSIATSYEQEARMRVVYDRVGVGIYKLLVLARNQNADKLARIDNKGSVAAIKAKYFIYCADKELGAIDPDTKF